PRRRPSSSLFPYTTLFRSLIAFQDQNGGQNSFRNFFQRPALDDLRPQGQPIGRRAKKIRPHALCVVRKPRLERFSRFRAAEKFGDRKSTRLNSSHVKISYA